MAGIGAVPDFSDCTPLHGSFEVHDIVVQRLTFFLSEREEAIKIFRLSLIAVKVDNE